MIYEIDYGYESIFKMVNGAKFKNKDGIEFVELDCLDGEEGENSDWRVIIKQDAKISEVMDRIPFGILNKTITGLGATTLELMNQERDSIIVVPTKALAYSKYKSANKTMGANYTFYVGSPIKEITQTPQKITAYLGEKSAKRKKFLVVADSVPLLIETLLKADKDIYHKYFFMVDEIDTMQADSAYRPKLEIVIDYYFQFDREWRCAVSATLNKFSNPQLELESKVMTEWRENPRRNIKLIYTNYVDDIAVKLINHLCKKHPEDKILIAYNSLDGILNILNQIKADKSNCGILCSERSDAKIKDYLEDTENVIDESGNLQKRIVFMTCAYFAGIDIQDQCRLITITSHLQPFTYLSTRRMAQIAGRCRHGNLSETIIYDIPEDRTGNEPAEVYKKNLLDKAHAYADFLNSAKRAANANPELKELVKFIDSFVDYAAKSKAVPASLPRRRYRRRHKYCQNTPL